MEHYWKSAFYVRHWEVIKLLIFGIRFVDKNIMHQQQKKIKNKKQLPMGQSTTKSQQNQKRKWRKDGKSEILT